MSVLVKFLGFTTLGCGCVSGRYREQQPPHKEEVYIDQKGEHCTNDDHQANRKLQPR